MLAPNTVVVNKSTVPVGSTRFVQRVLSEAGVAHEGITVASNPEFLREGQAVRDFLNPDRIVIGCDDPEAAVRVTELYKGVQAPVLVTDPASAEMIKYASNAFLATKVSFINAIANLCEARRRRRARGRDRHGLRRAHRLPVPASRSGLRRFVLPEGRRRAAAHGARRRATTSSCSRVSSTSTARSTSASSRRCATAVGGSLAGKVVGAWGLTFKADTDDLRDSPAIVICRRLARRGGDRARRTTRRRASKRAALAARRRVAARSLRRGGGRRRGGAAHRMGRVPLARLRAGQAAWCAGPRSSTPGTCSTRPRCAVGASTTPHRASLMGGKRERAGMTGTRRSRVGSRRADRRDRRRRLHRLAPVRQRCSRAATRSSRSTTSRPAGPRTSSTCAISPASRSCSPTSRDELPVDGRVDGVLHFASPASPPEYLAAPLETLDVGTLGTRRALDLARGQRRAVPRRLDQRGLRRPGRAPPARDLPRQRRPDRAARGVRRGEALRRDADDDLSPRSTACRPRSCASSTPTARGCGRPTAGWCRTSWCRRSTASR